MNTLLPTPLLGIGPLGTPEMVVIGVLILLLFGAKKLPQLARGLGKSMGEFRRAKDEFEKELVSAKHAIEEEVDDAKRPVNTPKGTKRVASGETDHRPF